MPFPASLVLRLV